jgi:hypothetical protein
MFTAISAFSREDYCEEAMRSHRHALERVRNGGGV